MRFYRGDIVWADLDPSAGHEQNRRRAVVVVSNNTFNERCSLAMAVPITSTDNGYPLHLDIGDIPTEDYSGSIRGYAEIEQLKSLDLAARDARCVGHLDFWVVDRMTELIEGCIEETG